MSEKYLPLFRKYRPQSFKDVVGQESLVKALSNAIELNRIANAYLFAGPRGTGKTSCARIFAKSLNCANGPTLEPCQKCPSCLDITNASGLDVIEIDAATNRGIDDAKELIAQTQYAPMNGKYKIFIIDEVHMLSNEAFNALLKTFEEPPQNVIFILATTEPHKVIETIVSRCQRFDLRRITTDDITKRLRQISDIENIKITDDALYTIAKNVSGGLRDSLALLDQVSILGAREEITKEDIENLLGKVTFDVAFNFLNTVLSKNVESAIAEIDKIYDRGLEPKNFCENLIEFLRNLIFTINSDDNESILKFTNFNKGDIEKIKVANLENGAIFTVLNKVCEAYKEIRFAVNPYLWAELMVIGLCEEQKPVQYNLSNQTLIKEDKKPQQQTTVVQTSNTRSIFTETLEEPKVDHSFKDVVQTVDKDLKPVKQPESIKEQVFEQNSAEPSNAPISNAPISNAPISNAPISNAPAQNDNYSSNTSLINPVEAWQNILNSISSVPAKFFYSGVAKLVNIDNSRVILGFVNENVINQAKSESKHKHLMAAINNVLGANVSAEFVLITPEIKIIDVNITPKVQEKPKIDYRQEMPLKNDMQQSVNIEPAASNSNSINTLQDTDTDSNPVNQDKKNKINLDNYGQKTKEMLETFNGKILE